MRIRKIDALGVEGNLVANEEVATIQMPGSSFIKNMKISVNGREVFDANSLYAYKQYMDTELSYPTTVKDSYLGASGYYRDSKDQDANNGDGYKKRKWLFGGSKTAQFITKIDADLFNQDVYLVNNCEIDIEITPNDARFILLAPGANNTNYKFEIISLKLYVKTIELMDGLSLDIARKLERIPAKYALRKTSIKSNFITQGRTEYNANLFTEQIPRRIILGFVDNASYVGNQNKSPFNFKPYNIREISITANGVTYPTAAYNFDFPNTKYVRAFHDMQDALGFVNTTESNGVDMERYKQGWCFFAFNLTNNQEDSQCFDLIKEGNTSVNIKFDQAVQNGGIVLIAMAEMDSLLMLDKNRTVTSDTTV
jgi:hypothetical protein